MSTKLRASCNSCHTAKVRCVKGNGRPQRCKRCWSLDEQCQYSLALPRIYRKKKPKAVSCESPTQTEAALRLDHVGGQSSAQDACQTLWIPPRPHAETNVLAECSGSTSPPRAGLEVRWDSPADCSPRDFLPDELDRAPLSWWEPTALPIGRSERNKSSLSATETSTIVSLPLAAAAAAAVAASAGETAQDTSSTLCAEDAAPFGPLCNTSRLPPTHSTSSVEWPEFHPSRDVMPAPARTYTDASPPSPTLSRTPSSPSTNPNKHPRHDHDNHPLSIVLHAMNPLISTLTQRPPSLDTVLISNRDTVTHCETLVQNPSVCLNTLTIATGVLGLALESYEAAFQRFAKSSDEETVSGVVVAIGGFRLEGGRRDLGACVGRVVRGEMERAEKLLGRVEVERSRRRLRR